MLAILASGSVWTGTNPAYTKAELLHHLVQSETQYVITNYDHRDVVADAVGSSGRDIEIILFTDIVRTQPPERICHGTEQASIHFRTLHDLLTLGNSSTLQEHLRAIPSHSPATVMSTSGTTGLPKMVQRSHRSLIAETSAIVDNNAAKPYPVRRLYCTPIFHAFSFPEMVINSLRMGYPSYYMRRLNDTFTGNIHKFAITETMAAPAMLLQITGRVEKCQGERFNLQSLRMVLCAGAPLASHLRSRFLQLFDHGSARIVQVWGMSEGGWFATFRYPEHDDTGSVGRPLPCYQVHVSESSLIKLSDGEQAGELLVQGRELAMTYMGNAGATRESFVGGDWLRSGDVGYVRNGKVYLIDRAKDIIKVNGWTVSPAELEGALYQVPGVLDAAALSYGHGTQEHAAIFVVAKEPTLSKADIMEHLLESVARFKVATCEIHLTDSLPRNPSGKILRRLLYQRLEVTRT